MTTHLTALEQQREDQAFGAAWRRCEAALPEGGAMTLQTPVKGAPEYAAIASGSIYDYQVGPTPTAALEALADALGARAAE